MVRKRGNRGGRNRGGRNHVPQGPRAVVLPQHGGFVLPPTFPVVPIPAMTTTYIDSFNGKRKVLFLDGMNMGKEWIGGCNTLRPNLKRGHLKPDDLDFIEALDVQGVPYVMVLNRMVMQDMDRNKISSAFTDKLLSEGRLILVDCSKPNSSADDLLLIQLTVTYQGIMVSKDNLRDHSYIGQMPWFLNMMKGYYITRNMKFSLGWNPDSL